MCIAVFILTVGFITVHFTGVLRRLPNEFIMLDGRHLEQYNLKPDRYKFEEYKEIDNYWFEPNVFQILFSDIVKNEEQYTHDTTTKDDKYWDDMYDVKHTLENFELYTKFIVNEETGVLEGVYYQPSENTEKYIDRFNAIEDTLFEEYRIKVDANFIGNNLSIENIGENFREFKYFYEFLSDSGYNDVFLYITSQMQSND